MNRLDLLKARHATLDILNHPETGSRALGVTPGGFHHDEDGAAWYVKKHEKPEQAYTEHLANKMYRDLGHSAPHSMILHDHEQRPVYFSKKIAGFKTLIESGGPQGVHHSQLAKLHHGAAADFLMHATDLHANNIGFTGQGTHATATRIDNGGAFHLGPMGDAKMTNMGRSVSDYVGMAHGFTEGERARQTGLSRADVHESVVNPRAMRGQVKKMQALRQQHGGWDKYVEHHIPQAPAETKAAISMHLDHRYERLLKHVTGYGAQADSEGPHYTPRPTPTHTPVHDGMGVAGVTPLTPHAVQRPAWVKP